MLVPLEQLVDVGLERGLGGGIYPTDGEPEKLYTPSCGSGGGDPWSDDSRRPELADHFPARLNLAGKNRLQVFRLGNGWMDWMIRALGALLDYPQLQDRLVLLDGWSKTYAMTGWRIGWTLSPANVAKAMGLDKRIGSKFLHMAIEDPAPGSTRWCYKTTESHLASRRTRTQHPVKALKLANSTTPEQQTERPDPEADQHLVRCRAVLDDLPQWRRNERGHHAGRHPLLHHRPGQRQDHAVEPAGIRLPPLR